MEKSGYSKERHDWSDDKRRKPYSLRPFKEYYEKDFILKYVPRGSKRDMEDGIDADIYEGAKITPIAIRDRPPMTAKGFNVCKARDVTIRTKKAGQINP